MQTLSNLGGIKFWKMEKWPIYKFCKT